MIPGISFQLDTVDTYITYICLNHNFLAESCIKCRYTRSSETHNNFLLEIPQIYKHNSFRIYTNRKTIVVLVVYLMTLLCIL